MGDLLPHPWNAGYVHAPPPGLDGLLSAGQLTQFDDEGFLVLPDLFGADEVAALCRSFDGPVDGVDDALRGLDDERLDILEAGAITFLPHLVVGVPAARTFAADERIARLCADLVGPDVNLYWDQAVYKRTEKPRRFPWHQDNGYVFVQPQNYLTVWIALTDATVDNGCPHVVAGMHRRGTLVHRYVDPLGWEVFADPPVEVVPAPVPAGGAVVFSSLTPHMTPANLTDAVRKAYILQYIPTGAVTLEGSADAAPPRCVPTDDPQRQFPVVRDGRPPPVDQSSVSSISQS